MSEAFTKVANALWDPQLCALASDPMSTEESSNPVLGRLLENVDRPGRQCPRVASNGGKERKRLLTQLRSLSSNVGHVRLDAVSEPGNSSTKTDSQHLNTILTLTVSSDSNRWRTYTQALNKGGKHHTSCVSSRGPPNQAHAYSKGSQTMPVKLLCPLVEHSVGCCTSPGNPGASPSLSASPCSSDKQLYETSPNHSTDVSP